MSKDERRAEIIRVAADLFEKLGYARASMDDIATAVGIGKPTLYHYFRSKSELLWYMHEELIDGLIESHLARVERGVGPAELLRGVIGDFLRNIVTRRGQCRVFFENHRELPDADLAVATEKRARYEAMVEDVIRDGIAAGTFREVDTKLFCLAIFGMSNWAYQWYHPDGKLTYDEIADAFWDYAYRGLRP
ncbi:TetR family transcriptional regulator [Actinomadura pelletieri DSM 43383]|uniref:TetR family transcriptional regulator n=1 Tax=Actinomadura pelletieri DSM 43383 TaxID=1120940 RepID=A0A495QT94_9ACTN|nr:TetR/AcrR family transcriptional regulator [Actinomadura pelletieri]RKS76637.1 TetR family transcriptional regulator [Actinomadura pelletieri DSM 43383]